MSGITIPIPPSSFPNEYKIGTVLYTIKISENMSIEISTVGSNPCFTKDGGGLITNIRIEQHLIVKNDAGFCKAYKLIEEGFE